MEEQRKRWRVRATCPHGFQSFIYFEHGSTYAEPCAHLAAEQSRDERRSKREERKLLRRFNRQLKRL